jgi:hypothetical protein
MKARAPILALLTAVGLSLGAGEPPSTFVGEGGVMRWSGSRAEVAQFGVNYTAPFAYSFRAHMRLGIPIEKAIDADVYHFGRLGFDAHRVHVWDREFPPPSLGAPKGRGLKGSGSNSSSGEGNGPARICVHLGWCWGTLGDGRIASFPETHCRRSGHTYAFNS